MKFLYILSPAPDPMYGGSSCVAIGCFPLKVFLECSCSADGEEDSLFRFVSKQTLGTLREVTCISRSTTKYWYHVTRLYHLLLLRLPVNQAVNRFWQKSGRYRYRRRTQFKQRRGDLSLRFRRVRQMRRGSLL